MLNATRLFDLCVRDWNQATRMGHEGAIPQRKAGRGPTGIMKYHPDQIPQLNYVGLHTEASGSNRILHVHFYREAAFACNLDNFLMMQIARR